MEHAPNSKYGKEWEDNGVHCLLAMTWAMHTKRWSQARRGIYGTSLASGKGVLFLEGCRMGYGSSEEKMLRDGMGMGHVHEALKALKALSARTGGCGQGT